MKYKLKAMPLLPMYLLIITGMILVAVIGNQAFTVFSENALTDTRKCVIIDAGHGGVDGGATSYTGVLESNINLEIALRLNNLLQLIGMKTVMIRNSDCSIFTEGESIAAKKVSDLKNRVSIINNTSNALLISIHQNYYPDSKYSGAQVFYSNKEGSVTLANQLQKQLVETLNPGSNRKAKKASGIYLMDKIKCTGVLVECGFISNLQEEQLLLSAEYQKKLCCVIAAGCSTYLYCDNA